MSTYSDKLKDPRWQKKRLEILERDNYSCNDCGTGLNGGKTLHVHHKEYIFGKDPWDYSEENFITLCEGCHAARHNIVPDLMEKPEEDFSIIAAYSVLYSALKSHIRTLFNDTDDSNRHAFSIFYYENVQVEDYLIFFPRNDPGTANDYLKMVNMAERAGIESESYEMYCFRLYLELRGSLIRRVLDAMITENLEDVKLLEGDESQRGLLILHQRLSILRIKFNAFFKSEKENRFKSFKKFLLENGQAS
jgi:hypothetical protein